LQAVGTVRLSKLDKLVDLKDTARERSAELVPRMAVWINGTQVDALIDDGSDVTIVDAALVERDRRLKIIKGGQIRLSFIQGETEIDGECHLQIDFPDGSCGVKAVVLRDVGEDLLLGRDFLLMAKIDCRLNKAGWCFTDTPDRIFPFVKSQNEQEKFKCHFVSWRERAERQIEGPARDKKRLLGVVDGFNEKGLFSEKPGNVRILEHEIKIKPGTKPYMCGQRMMSQKKMEAFDRELVKFIDLGIIERTTSAWGCAPVIVEKPGSTPENPLVRVCFDWRKLNAQK